MCEVSIIVPVYNTEKYLGKCLDSVLAQSSRDFELILVDDGSSDASGAICDRYAERDARIRVVRQENRGVSAARNTGLDRANGMYILFVDSDDLLPDGALESLLSAARGDAYDLVIGDCAVVGKNQKHSVLNAESRAYSSASLCVEMMIAGKTKLLMSAVWAKLFRNDVIQANGLRFDVSLINGEDGGFIADYLSRVARIYNVRSVVYTLYRYEEAERISAVSAFYYDFFEFYLSHAQKLWRIAGDGVAAEMKTTFYSRFLDELIIYLIHAVAYEDCFTRGRLASKLNDIVKNEMVRRAIAVYRRTNPSFSLLIPLCIRVKNSRLLYLALRMRVRRYWRTHKRARLVKSVYRERQKPGES